MNSGPYAVVLEFRLPGDVPRPSPERLHAAFLGLIGRGDRTLATLLHSPKLGRRPFSLCLIGNPKVTGKLRLRLSVLAPELFQRFWERWERRGGIPLRLSRHTLEPLGLVGDGPWAGITEWNAFLEGPHHREVVLHFATPTAFRAGDLDLPLPVPRLVFGGLLAKWNAFSPLTLEVSPEEIARRIALSGHRIRSRAVFDGRAHIVGFVGRARFRALRGSSPELVKAMNALARFAFFAGVGRKTTHGMGLVRVVGDEGVTSD